MDHLTPSFYINVLDSKNRYDVVWAYCSLMLGITIVCGVASRLLSPLLVANYKKFSPVEKWDWDTRLGSSIHAAVSTALGIYIVLGAGVVPGFGTKPTVPESLWHTPLTHAGAGLSLGYFIADTFALLYYFPRVRAVDHPPSPASAVL